MQPARPSLARTAMGVAALVVLLVAGAKVAYRYLTDPAIPRPPDFLQVWAAGQLNLSGANPYGGEEMYALQSANRMPDTRTPERPNGHASMMWVPPWGLALAMPVGALPIDLAQMLWGLGQLVLIFVAALVLWRMHGGARERWWVPVVLVLGFGPVWWQAAGGQYAGVILVGLVGFLWAHQKGRPVTAGAWAALTALKPHLLLLFAIGIVIDALRTAWGRKVVLGGGLVLAAAAAVVTIANPNVWGQYLAATTGPGSEYYPGLADWFNPTIGAWLRHAVPGQPFWVQCMPAAVAVLAFAVYWWRCGGPDRWPTVLPWVIPVSLLVAPYGSWTSDMVLLFVPLVGLAARLDARRWQAPGRWAAAAVYAAANIAVVAMIGRADLQTYVWVAPVLCGCLLWAAWAVRQPVPAPRPAPVAVACELTSPVSP